MTLPHLTPEQFTLTGQLEGSPPSPAPATPQPPASAAANQLVLTAVQEILTAAAPAGRQLALIDDPPFWEAETAAPRPRRTRRRASRKEPLSPGQMSLF